MLRTLDLFSGIGGFSLGLERTGGFETVAFCEIEEFPRRVLAKHWPNVPIHRDVRELRAEHVGAVDVICGGFPCQDISTAGKGAGLAGERSGLWSEYARLVGEARPCWVIVENVAALLGRGLGTVLGDLAALGYDAEWDCIPASAVGAPHRRDRLWIVAYPGRVDCNGRRGERRGPEATGPRNRPARSGEHAEHVADANGEGPQGRNGEVLRERASERAAGAGGSFPDAHRQPTRRLAITWGECGQWLAEPDVGRVAHGVPARVDRLRGLGNAVVPQIPEIIGRAILKADATLSLKESQ